MKRKLPLAFVLALGCAAPAKQAPPPPPPPPPVVAQPAPVAKAEEKPVDPWAGRTDLIQPPVPVPAKEIDVGVIETLKLKNGLTVVLVPRNDLPAVEVELTVRVGELDNPEGKEPLAGYTAQMLTKGTKKRDADQLSATIEQLGGSLGASASTETSAVSCGALSKDAHTCLDLVADVAINAAFPEKEMSEVRDQLIGGVKQQFDQPSSLAEEHLMNQLYGDDHPQGRVTTEKSIAAIDRAALKAFHGKWFLPNNAYLSLSGQFDPKQARKDIERLFGKWKKGKLPERKAHAIPPHQGMKILLVDKPELNQAQIRVAHAGIRFSDPDRFAVKLMNYTLGGGGFSSRLMKVIRSEKGKTYGISSRFDEPLEGQGAFQVSTFTRTEETLRTLTDALAEIERYKSEGPTDDELLHAKGNISGSYPIGLQHPSALAGRLVSAFMRGLDLAYVKSYAVRLCAVDRASAMKAAQTRLDPKDVVVVIVGDGKQVGTLLDQAKLPFERVLYSDPISARERSQAAADKKAKAGLKVDDSAGKALVAEALKAAGGEVELRKLKDLTAKLEAKIKFGTQEVPATFLTYKIVPGKFRFDVVVMGQEQHVVVTEDTAFMEMGGQMQELPPDKARKQRKQPDGLIPALGLLRALDDRSKLIVKQPNVLEIIDAEGDSNVFHLDPQSHLVIKIESDKQTFAIGDYKPEHGVQVAHTIKIEGGPQQIEMKLLELKVNQGLKVDLFKKQGNR